MDIAADPLFFIDVSANGGASISEEGTISSSLASKDRDATLCLPSHVTILGNMPVEVVVPPFRELEEADFIQYLEYDETRDAVRYFHELGEANVISRQICKNCGAEGHHRTSACPVQICLTCGARDEHSTRSCPISKVCFTCGMKGHINARCPNRRISQPVSSRGMAECDRCSGTTHISNECPTLWRLYEYTTGEDRNRIIATRETKRHIKLGEGGEGHVGDDEWCYNCASPGHWGDDCDTLTQVFSTEDYSAFSSANVMMGPFNGLVTKSQSSRSRSHVNDYDRSNNRLRIRGASWRGRPTAPQRQTMQPESDPDEFFSSPSLRRDGSYKHTKQDRGCHKTFTFGKIIGVAKEPPSLMERMGLESRIDIQSDRHPSKNEHQSTKISQKSGDPVHHGNDHAGGSGLHSAPRYGGGYGR